MSSSVRKWVTEIPWMQQGVLFSALRGCDGLPHNDVSKIIIRGYRNTILKPAHFSGSFLGMIPLGEDLVKAMNAFSGNFDKYPMHFLTHLAHASEIIGYKHPNKEVRDVWEKFYVDIVRRMHLYPESKIQMEERLKDDSDTVANSTAEDNSI
jgi:hypothetical protein